MKLIHYYYENNSYHDHDGLAPKLLLSAVLKMYTSTVLFLLIIIIPFATPISYYDNTTFEFPEFDPNNHDILYEWNASASNGVIQLTTNQLDKGLNWSVGRATFEKPMHLWDKASGNVADFNTHFSFVIDSQGKSPYADGFAFFLAPNGSRLLPDSRGENLGLVSNNSTNKSIFVAVEFDTYSNPQWDSAVVGDHVGIDVNSIKSEKSEQWWWSDIKKGKRAEAWISYDSGTKNLSLLLTDDDGNVTSLYYIIHLNEYLPEWVTFGFSGATGLYFEMHKILSWNFSSSLQIADDHHVTNNSTSPSHSPPTTSKNKIWLWVVLSAVACFSVAAALVWFGCWMKIGERSGKNEDDINEFERAAVPRQFPYNELVAATNNFADEKLLGEGGFGRVYQGFLNSRSVAVKRITPESRQGMKEYASEVKAISGLRHRNLVQLNGWCREKNELIIVYEFMPNKSLDFHLFKEEEYCLLTWEKRRGIALGLASALLYLQEECEQCVLHRDIKSSNVLLDSDFNAKLGDFGLARLVDHGGGSQTTDLIGTRGYMAPEYLESGKAIKESDVYSFGIVALEIACGKRAVKEAEANGNKFEIRLVEQVWEQYGSGNVIEEADPRLCGDYDVEQMESLLVVGLWCAHPDYRNRPSVKQAIDVLHSKDPLPLLPPTMPKPTFFSPPLLNMYSGSNTGSSKLTSSSRASGEGDAQL